MIVCLILLAVLSVMVIALSLTVSECNTACADLREEVKDWQDHATALSRYHDNFLLHQRKVSEREMQTAAGITHDRALDPCEMPPSRPLRRR